MSLHRPQIFRDLWAMQASPFFLANDGLQKHSPSRYARRVGMRCGILFVYL